MNKVTLYKASLILTAILCLVGAFFKIQHYPYGNILLTMGKAISLVVMFLCLTDIYKDDHYNTSERFLWTIGFIFLSWISGVLYFPKYKKRNLI